MGKNRGGRAYFVDPLILPRVQEYADEQLEGTSLNSAEDLRFALRDVDAIVEYLVRKYPRSYARKSRPILARSVAKAVQVICSKKERNENGNLSVASQSGDEEDGDEYGGGDSVAQSDSNPDEPEHSNTTMPSSKPNVLNNALTRQYTDEKSTTTIPIAEPVGANTTTNSDKAPDAEMPPSTPPRGKRQRASSTSTGGLKKRPKRGKEDVTRLGGGVERPSIRYCDLGGIDHCLQDVRELIEYPLRHPEIYAHLGVEPPRGILLHGPPGTGKTMLANAIAGEIGVPFIKISAPEIVSGMSGESEAKIRELFEQALELAPCIVFIDEIDAITPKRESAQREMERRIVAQLLTSMDSLSEASQTGTPVVVIGATNRPEALDPALRRAGRFDREISLGIPDMKARARILRVLCNKLKLNGEVDMDSLAQRTPGYVGADLVALTREAAVIAVNRIFQEITSNQPAPVNVVEDGATVRSDVIDVTMDVDKDDRAIAGRQAATLALMQHEGPLTAEQLEPLSIEMSDFEAALGKVQPSAKREGFATIPDVTWADVGALSDVREEMQMAILEPIRAPEKFAAVGLTAPSGVLLYGPPGCGKTLLAKAIANESGASFISIKGPELLNKYVGESERSIRLIFQRARDSAPCVMFFDELDALCPRRGAESHASERVVNQLLTEMDGLESRKQVFVIGATNRPDIIDPAMLRPGRLDKLLYVDLPSQMDRASILRTVSRKAPLAPDVNIDALAAHSQCTDFSGADLAALVKEATVAALRESLRSNTIPLVTAAHFHTAFQKVQPSVSAKDRRVYSELKNKLRKARGHLTDETSNNPTNSAPST